MAKIVSFGELLMRLTTQGTTKLQINDNFCSNFGGSEANVAIALAKLKHDVTFVTRLPNNEIGLCAKEYLYANHLNTEYVVLNEGRMGLYFVEKGRGIRQTKIIYDRQYSSFSLIDKFTINLEELFKDVDYFFVSGITPALSKYLEDLVEEIVMVAKKLNVKVVFDINYRSKLWDCDRAFNTIKRYLPYVDVLSAGLKDCQKILNDEKIVTLENAYYLLLEAYPNIEYVFSTTRNTFSAEHFDIQAHVYHNRKLSSTKFYKVNHVVDRIGAGDAFIAGVIHGLASQLKTKEVIDFGIASTVLKHTVYGDANDFNMEEIQAFIDSDGNANIQR